MMLDSQGALVGWQDKVPSPAILFEDMDGHLLGPCVGAGVVARAVWAIQDDDGEWRKIPPQHWHNFDHWQASGTRH